MVYEKSKCFFGSYIALAFLDHYNFKNFENSKGLGNYLILNIFCREKNLVSTCTKQNVLRNNLNAREISQTSLSFNGFLHFEKKMRKIPMRNYFNRQKTKELDDDQFRTTLLIFKFIILFKNIFITGSTICMILIVI